MPQCTVLPTDRQTDGRMHGRHHDANSWPILLCNSTKS